MSDFEIRLGGGEFSFDRSFLQFNVKKKIYAKKSSCLTLNAEH